MPAAAAGADREGVEQRALLLALDQPREMFAAALPDVDVDDEDPASRPVAMAGLASGQRRHHSRIWRGSRVAPLQPLPMGVLAGLPQPGRRRSTPGDDRMAGKRPAAPGIAERHRAGIAAASWAPADTMPPR